MNDSDMVATKIPGFLVSRNNLEEAAAQPALYRWFCARMRFSRDLFMIAGYRTSTLVIEMPKHMERWLWQSATAADHEDSWDDELRFIGAASVRICDDLPNTGQPLAQMVGGVHPSDRMTRVVVLIPSLEEAVDERDREQVAWDAEEADAE